MKTWFAMGLLGGVLLATGCASEVASDETAGTGGGGDETGTTSTADASTGVGSPSGTTTSGGPSSGTSTGNGAGGGGEGGAEPGVGGAGGAMGEGGASPETVCERTAAIDIVSVELDGEDWPPGEQRTVRVTLLSATDHMDYPGAFVQSSDVYVSTATPENYFFGLAAGEPNTLDFVFQAADFLEPGTPVRFDAHVVAMGQVCEGTATATLDITLD